VLAAIACHQKADAGVHQLRGKGRGLQLNRLKIKYMECKFSKNISVDDVMNKFEHQIIPRKYQF